MGTTMEIRYSDPATRARILDVVDLRNSDLYLVLDRSMKPGTAQVEGELIEFEAAVSRVQQPHGGSAEACTTEVHLVDLPKGIQ